MSQDTLISVGVAVVAVASIATSFGVIWLCVMVTSLTRALSESSQKTLEAADILQCSVIDALAGIQEDVIAAKMQAVIMAKRVDIGTELGYQNAEAADRMEHAAAEVAHDLADSIGRADAQPKDGDYGRAADAALRSASSKDEDGAS